MEDERKEPSLINKANNEPETTIPATPSVVWRPQDADKEDIKSYTRYRVRHATVGPNVTFKPAKPKPTIKDEGHKRVAVYARVSTKSAEQVSSIENQTKYYTEKIENTENWELQEIYSDEGKSGTSMRKRIRFKQMIEDAGEKKMDLILCASVSRFARNVSDCIEQVRQLRTMNPSHPVGVYFETENIYTLDPDSNQMLTMHAMLADWESANKSRRMILSYDQRICTGQYPVADLLGYKHTIDGDLLIEEEGAKTVKFIFYAFISGMSCEKIARILTEKKRPTLKGRTDWNAAMVRNIMQNERRWGDLDVRKTIVIDYVKGKTVRNDNIRDGAYVTQHHQGIVSPAVAKAAKLVAASGKRLGAGVMDISVIEQGALKGFVSVCPSWGGIYAEAFIKVCSNVYTAEELEQLTFETDVRSGKEHSKIISMQFDGYEVPYGAFFLKRNCPIITLSSKRVFINKACHERLDNCRYIEVLYNPILQAIILRASNKDTPNAIPWINSNGKIELNFYARAFCSAIYEQLHLVRDYRFKFRGVLRERGKGKILFCYLDEPQILVGKRKKRLDVLEKPENGIRYIKFKTDDEHEDFDTDDSILAYPEYFEENLFGTSYALRRWRDRLFSHLTEADIRERGVVVDNPMIGVLPSRDEVKQEIQNLLQSM